MKRTLIALGVAATVALPMVAEAAPKIYGRLDVTVQKNDAENTQTGATTEDRIGLASNASRFGVKGEDELTATLSAVYGIEWGIAADGDNSKDDGIFGDSGDLSQRNRYIGLKGGFGTVKLGKYDTYLKAAQGKVDLFNDTVGDMKSIVAGETRTNDAIGYESPKFADALSLNVMLVPGEQSGTTGQDEYNGLTDGISASVVYDNVEINGLYLALAYDKEMVGNLVMVGSNLAPFTGAAADSNDRRDTMRAVASYKIADLTLGALYQVSEAVNNPAPAAAVAEEETAMLVGVAYKISDVTLKAQYVVGENDAEPTAQERTQMTVGADYHLTSKTKVYGFYNLFERENGGDSELTNLALGIQHNF